MLAQDDDNAPDILREPYLLPEEQNPPYQCGHGYQEGDGQTANGTDVTAVGCSLEDLRRQEYGA